MQHPDEGTIHAWLDGALSVDEAARVETHVKDCAQCQAAVAEARGFIAASSRILTALDDAPRGVIPAAAAKKRMQPWVWRVAATVLVVAVGTWATLRQLGPDKSYPELSSRTAATQVVADTAATPSAVEMPQAGAVSQSNAVAQGGPTATLRVQVKARSRSSQPSKPTTAGTVSGALRPNNGERAAPSDERRIATAAKAGSEVTSPVAAPPATMRAQNMTASDFVAPMPRQVSTKRMIGTTQTFYEIAPGDTVILEEHTAVQLNEVVTTGAGLATDRRVQTMAGRAAAKGAAAPETQQKTPAATAPPPAAAPQDARGSEIHSISWLDRSSGRVLILSGRHPQEELQAIRERIQQLRDAAQAKKNPD